MDHLEPDDPTRISGYELRGRLGAGGMGVVYYGEAAHGRRVALKVIEPRLANDADFRARFRREIAAMLKVSSPCVVPVVGADPDGDPPWLATEYVSAPDLWSCVRTGGVLKTPELRKLTLGLAQALVAIRAAGLTHRDLKPTNILMDDGEPRVIDFGLAVAPGDATLTGKGYVVGTLPYMSPEQIAGKPVGPPSDVYSLAAVVVYAATGAAPSGGGSTDPLKGQLRRVIEGCLAVDPADRPTPEQIIERLAPAEVVAEGPSTPVPTKVLEKPVENRPNPKKYIAWTIALVAALCGTAGLWGASVSSAHAGGCINHSFGDEEGWNLDLTCAVPMPFASNYRVLYMTTTDNFGPGGCARRVGGWNSATDVEVTSLKADYHRTVSFCARPLH